MEVSQARLEAMRMWLEKSAYPPSSLGEYKTIEAMAAYLRSGTMPEPFPLPKAA
jgi:hypothetical protein